MVFDEGVEDDRVQVEFAKGVYVYFALLRHYLGLYFGGGDHFHFCRVGKYPSVLSALDFYSFCSFDVIIVRLRLFLEILSPFELSLLLSALFACLRFFRLVLSSFSGQQIILKGFAVGSSSLLPLYAFLDAVLLPLILFGKGSGVGCVGGFVRSAASYVEHDVFVHC